MKIYTKVGDGGKTALYGGAEIGKDSPLIEAIGAVDEANAALGLALASARERALREKLTALQNDLFVVGADLGTPVDAETPNPVPRIGAPHAARLEKEIDALQAALPPLKNFILPGGSATGAALHMARALSRRAERAVVPLLKTRQASLDLQIYLNRLSDYLFLLARRANQIDIQPETPWAP